MSERTEHGHKPPPQIATTGHEWDGIHELNTPLPRWWLWLFYATIIWAVGYWIVYPSWPLLTSYSKGVLGWHARSAVVSDLAALQAQRGPMIARLEATPLADIESTPQLLDFARALGRAAFADNCAPCHGAGGGGARGYPNLTDDDWLWGGTLADIEQTIRHGVRSTDDKGHQGAMPAFGRDGMLKRDDIVAVADYVRSLSGLSTTPGADLGARRKNLRRQLRRLSRPAGQGQPRARRPQSDRQDLALRVGHQDHHRRHLERPRRRDAGLGRQARRCHDQGADGLRAHVRRRGEVTDVPLL